MSPLSLQQFNALVREALAACLPDSYWVTAELSEVRSNPRGHCYLGLVEKDEWSDALVAKGSAVMWANIASVLIPRFERETGAKWAPGIKVLLKMEVAFHEVYGLQYKVVGIDSSYTLGDLQRRRHEIIRRLTEEGVVDMNKGLSLPRPLLRIAVISSATAAGYGDFCNQLAAAPYAFHTQLFPAIMQGDGVEASILDALDHIYIDMEAGAIWDAVVIIRGGGAVSDLNGFDTYMLAAAVAQFPLPILTGIGHERDETVLDLVACRRFKTPTAVAAFLVETADAEMANIQELANNLQTATNRLLHQAQLSLQHLDERLRAAALRTLDRQSDHLKHLHQLLRDRSRTAIDSERQRHNLLGHLIRAHAQRGIDRSEQRLQYLQEALPVAFRRALHTEAVRLDHIADKLALASPERSLRLGFSITRCNGRVVRNANDLKPGEELVTQLAEGEVHSQVLYQPQPATSKPASNHSSTNPSSLLS